jgi:hypothetical protein
MNSLSPKLLAIRSGVGSRQSKQKLGIMGFQSKIQKTITILFRQKQHLTSRILSFFLLALLGLGLVFLLGTNHDSSAIAQNQPSSGNTSSIRVEGAAAIVYQQLPYLPKENGYISKETGEINPEHTLISRFIRYSQDLKKRTNRYRFDWKLTLADYLGANETINPETYPGSLTLTTNPFETDVKAIQALNRRQRQELVDLLAFIYKPQVTTQAPKIKPSPTPQSTPIDESGKPSLAKPGDAQLLMP